MDLPVEDEMVKEAFHVIKEERACLFLGLRGSIGKHRGVNRGEARVVHEAPDGIHRVLVLLLPEGVHAICHEGIGALGAEEDAEGAIFP